MLKLCDSVVTVVVRFDGLCVLPINMINDKIYIALWFWLFLLLVISSLHFVFRCLTTSASKSYIRRFVITEMAHTRAFSCLKAGIVTQ